MPKVLRSRTKITIHRPASDVFRFVAEDFFDNARKWFTQILEVRKTSDGPIHVGTTGVAVGLGSAGQATSDVEILEHEPSSVFSFRAETLPSGLMSWRAATPLLTHSVLRFVFDPTESAATMVTIYLETDLTQYPLSFRVALRSVQPRDLVAMGERIKTLVESRAENL